MFKRTILLYICVLGHLAAVGQCFFSPIDTSGFECTSARYLCGSQLNGYTGSLTSVETPGTQPDNFCGFSSAENIQWFSFLVSENDVEINISFSNCMGGTLFDQGFQSGVYSGCDFIVDDLVCVSQMLNSGVNNVVFTTTPGIHYLFVDGFAGSICDFSIEVVSGICVDPFATTNAPDAICRPSDISNPAATEVQMCQGETQFLRPDLDFPPIYDNCDVLDTAFADIVDGQPFFCVETIISDPSSGTFVSGEYININYSNPQSTLISQPISVRWDSVGIFEVTQTIYANPYLPSCLSFDTICSEALTVTVLPFDTTFLVPDTICEGQVFDFCSTMWGTSQVIMCPDRTNCSVAIKPLFVQPRSTVDLDTVFVCGSGCFEIYGNNYCAAGSFSDTGTVFCDTIFNFTVVPVTVDLSIAGDTIITCSEPAVNLVGAATTNYTGPSEYRWIDEAGMVVSTDAVLSTNVSGSYIFEVTFSELEPCVFVTTTTVVEDVDLPMLELSSPVLSCLTLSGNIEAASTSTITSYNWTGPGGFSSDMSMSTVTDTGLYELTVFAINGCSKDTTLRVSGQFEEPDIALAYEDLDCNITTGLATFVSNTGVSQEWLLPNTMIVSTTTLNYSQAGDYLLTVTAANGCSSDSLFEVLDLVNDPTLSILNDTVWRCNTSEISIDISADPNLTSQWSTENGMIRAVSDSLVIVSTGTYVGTVTDLTTGCIGVDTITIIDDPNILALDFLVSDPLCFGESSGSIEPIFLAGEPPYTLTINGEIADLTDLDTLTAGTYSLEFEDAYGCEIDTVFTLVDPSEVIIMADSPINYKVGSELTLYATHNIPEEEVERLGWYDRWGNEYGTGLELYLGTDVDSTYYLQVWNNDGCTDQTVVEIIFDFTKTVYAPNIFSPNGDGHQDYWTLKSVGTPDVIDQVQVYSRWGELVYERSSITYNDEQQGWDGKQQGQPCTAGVYIYKAVYRDIDGVQFQQVGSITLVR